MALAEESVSGSPSPSNCRKYQTCPYDFTSASRKKCPGVKTDTIFISILLLSVPSKWEDQGLPGPCHLSTQIKLWTNLNEKITKQKKMKKATRTQKMKFSKLWVGSVTWAQAIKWTPKENRPIEGNYKVRKIPEIQKKARTRDVSQNI